MQFSYAAVAAVLATAVSAHEYGYVKNSTAAVWVTDVVTAYTTYCPGPTKITHGAKTYTVTEATTLTITDCPCTISKPAYVTPVVYCSTCSVTPVYHNATSAYSPPTAAPPAATGTAAPVKPGPAYTNAANKAVMGSAAGLAGVLALVAYAL